jgi:hypothetical protein
LDLVYYPLENEGLVPPSPLENMVGLPLLSLWIPIIFHRGSPEKKWNGPIHIDSSQHGL